MSPSFWNILTFDPLIRQLEVLLIQYFSFFCMSLVVVGMQKPGLQGCPRKIFLIAD